ncbi:hypothetical protein F2Q68_00030768 [Brassica cretica]|uniref:Uncharacterized protein n=2 Tax=Brassica cretica TaxID=69181 RepID=A0A8S9GD26_BRACR|nr:hypothetical protein F2Q68_00030768 [Brassica cretica]KAF3532172.1 hypothetical protein DY000_02039321 [Brassica cretica]
MDVGGDRFKILYLILRFESLFQELIFFGGGDEIPYTTQDNKAPHHHSYQKSTPIKQRAHLATLNPNIT